ncbi:uncharacterized protein N7482_004600 [Penicillium canariense]|uniref:Uncharacterized protein n=1 Tax=Penicillium canariense TaxID=189055 RepID=A0A9W9I956_9EURO|nr:uncharacterized protein N7482_004600 [Penicillium canariense]KAJ5169006.1 hypothetical protein N7482_004600 [Penicillium canariense]
MLSTSLVILGLTPTLLSNLGPTIAESSTLSSQRPLLSWLLSFGAPAVMMCRIWTYDDPYNTIASRRNSSKLLDHFAIGRTRRYRWLINIVEYVFALAAIANIIHVSLDLEFRSVSTWYCESWWFPLTWVLILGLIHAIGTISFWMTPKTVGCADEAEGLDGLASKAPRIITTQAPNLLDSDSELSGLGHVMYGTLVFSSLMFLMVEDAVPVIIRYAASAVMCRFIIQYEEYRVKLDSPGGPERQSLEAKEVSHAAEREPLANGRSTV